ncbi:amidase [Rhizobium sullae]|uniref:Amidase n=1 Tax=Rhizobium sullae TaxID=50338 RepID=A0A2N0DEG3_RHISU|nr:amidase [Rhizobium sullae]PKA44491.1 amidase [Rhizobium sullae]
MTQLWQLDAAQLFSGYERGAFTPVDVIEACLDRLQACEPEINAFVHIDRAGALSAAQASERRWSAGQPFGRLDGVPVSIKDNLHVSGMPTTWGTRLLQDYVPLLDEMPVERLRAAGAVLFGKTSLPEFAMQGYTANLIKGVTRNPWNCALTPGGSSGGAVAAVAAGCGPLALATDGGGSIRRPSSHCGLVGFKPSAGAVRRGRGLPEIFLDYEVAGAIGRTVADIAAMTEVLSGRRLEAEPGKRRILYVPRFSESPVDPGIAQEVRGVAERLSANGHSVEEASSFDLADGVNQLWPLLSAVGLAWLFEEGSRWPELGIGQGARADEALCGEAARQALEFGRAARSDSLFSLLQEVSHLEKRLCSLFASHDMILTPATAAFPWRADDAYPDTIDGHRAGPRGHAVFTAIANAAGLPALAMPSAFVGDLPTGFQLLGSKGADADVIALAREYEMNVPAVRHWPEFDRKGQALS